MNEEDIREENEYIGFFHSHHFQMAKTFTTSQIQTNYFG